MKLSKYITTQGDTWDMISYKVYGDEYHVDTLMYANISYIKTVIFPANIELTIPQIEVATVDSLPPWKRGNSIG